MTKELNPLWISPVGLAIHSKPSTEKKLSYEDRNFLTFFNLSQTLQKSHDLHNYSLAKLSELKLRLNIRMDLEKWLSKQQ